MNSWEFYSRIEMFKHTQKDDELAHYGITGQKWGTRRWQNPDGTFNQAGKERYFGTKSSSSSDDKISGARSNVKDYLKFRNKMLKKHAKADMDKWYIEEHKEDDKKLLKDAKRIDKSSKKMYENQLKDYYDNPNDLVDDLNKVYKFGSNDKEEKALQKEADKINKSIMKNKMSIRDFIDSDKCNDIKNMATELTNKNCMDELKDLTDIFKDYKYHNYNYSALAGITNALEHPYFGKNMGDISNAIVGYVYDDFDQGYGNSAAIYLYDKGYTADQISKISERNLNNRDNVKNAISISIEKDPLLSKLNKANKIRIRNWIEDDASYMLVNDDDRRNKEGDRYSYDTYSMWVGNADDGIQSNKSEKSDKYLPEAKKIFNKVSKTCNSVNDGWWCLNQAINELGYSDVNYKDLTDSDWNKINEKIRELG